jgi:hypothetical protein
LVEVIPDIENGQVQTQLKNRSVPMDSVNRAPMTSMAEEQRAKSSCNWGTKISTRSAMGSRLAIRARWQGFFPSPVQK